jgi:hypothetical protein
LPAVFTTKSIGYRGLHQTSAEVPSPREETLCTACDSVSVGRIVVLCLCNVPGFDER